MKNIQVLGVCLFFLIIAGLAARSQGILALALPLLVYLGSALLFAPGKVKIEATREQEADTSSHGKPVSIKLTITNKGDSLDEVRIEDLVPAGLEMVDGVNRQQLSFLTGQTIELSYSVRGNRGQHIFQGVRITSSEHAGLVVERKLLDLTSQLVIYPASENITRLLIRPPQTRGFSGPIAARQSGSGVDFLGVREYQSGDPRRKINWRLSTRHDQTLFTNEFEQERIADVGLVLDARQRRDIRGPGISTFEYCITATASLAKVLIKNGHRVSLLVYGFGIERVFPGYGKVQEKRIMQALSRAVPGKNYALESLNYLTTRLFPAKSQVIVISTLGEDDLPELFRLRAHGYSVWVVSPDPIDFEASLYKSHPMGNLAIRLARLERTLLIRHLQQANIHVINWPVDKPLNVTVRLDLDRQRGISRYQRRMR